MVFKIDIKCFFKQHNKDQCIELPFIIDWFIEYKDFSKGTSVGNLYNFRNAILFFGKVEGNILYFDWQKIYLKLKIKFEGGGKNEVK